MRRSTALVTIAAFLLMTAGLAAQTGSGTLAPLSASYDLTWSSVDGGGATFSTGGSYSLGGTVGQPDAGLMTGGGYSLGGGFWGGGTLSGEHWDIYLPLLTR